MDAWPRCLQHLEAELPAEDVHTWLKPLQAGQRDDGLVLYAPNAFVMEEVRARYLERIRELLAHFAGSPDVSLEIGSLRRVAAPSAAPANLAPPPPARPLPTEPFHGNIDTHYSFDNFVEGRSNQLGRARRPTVLAPSCLTGDACASCCPGRLVFIVCEVGTFDGLSISLFFDAR